MKNTVYETAAFNSTTTPDSKHLSYNQLIKHYLDEDTITSGSYLTEEEWADT